MVAPTPYSGRVECFDSITVENIRVTRRKVSGDILVKTTEGVEERFPLIFTYSEDIFADQNTAGLMLTMPAINFTFFSRNLVLNFPVSDNDRALIGQFLKINAREVFVNKICRRRYEFFRKDFLPGENDISENTADGSTELVTPVESKDGLSIHEIPATSMVLSSGGKESLLTYAMLHEMGNEPYAYFFNESGGHWRTAKTSYDYFAGHFRNVVKVWSNVDRFYRFMIKRLKILDQAAVLKRADTYPVQLFIFPVYIFSAIPLLQKHGIGNILMGNEFDDPREMPLYKGIHHYYGVYDQSPDFMKTVSEYFSVKGIPARLWSAVYPISGIMVEEILVKRYRDFFLQQRSCHSCRTQGGEVYPCGTCTKCLGVMMFILAAGGNPEDIKYSMESISRLKGKTESSRMRLDSDEMAYLKARLWGEGDSSRSYTHVRGIHRLPDEKESMERIPDEYRKFLGSLYSRYGDGSFRTEGSAWIMDTQK